MKWVIAENHPSLKEFLLDFFSKHFPDIQLFTANNGLEALEVFKKHEIALLFTDNRMENMTGLELSEVIRRERPHTKIIIYTQFNDEKYVSKALDLEVDGYVLKTTSTEEMLMIVNDVLDGKKYFDKSALDTLKIREEVRNRLSKRQLEIVGLLCKGKSAREIADKLNISEGTVKAHRIKIYENLGFNHITRLTVWAVENKII